MIIGGFGYYSGARGKALFLQIYIFVLSVSSFLSMFTGVGMILKTASIKDAINKEWFEIQNRLKSSGYDISESTFSSFIEVNLKFGGLFLIVYCLFLILGLIPAIYLFFILRKKGNVVLTGIG